MEIKNLVVNGQTIPVLHLEEDDEVRLFLLTEIDQEALLFASPHPFRYTNFPKLH